MAIRLYVGNLPYTVNQSKLEEMFSPFGKVTTATVISDKFSGRSKGFGFIEYESDDSAREAIAKMNGVELEGRALVVNEARPREERPAGSGFGGGNGGSRGGFNRRSPRE